MFLRQSQLNSQKWEIKIKNKEQKLKKPYVMHTVDKWEYGKLTPFVYTSSTNYKNSTSYHKLATTKNHFPDCFPQRKEKANFTSNFPEKGKIGLQQQFIKEK